MVIIFSLIAGNYLSATAEAKTNYIEGTDPAAVLFDPTNVTDFHLNISQSDFESLKYPNVTWDQEGEWRETKMTFTMNKKVYGPYKVGMHLKGAWGSWRDVTEKAGFKIKIDAFIPGQRFFGLSKITLNNMIQDPTYMHEAVTYRLMRSVGVPAPRTGYSNVFLNGINYGLHLNVETVNPTMLKRYGISSAHMYKGAVPNFPDLTSGNEKWFAIESGSTTDTSDLTQLIAVNSLSGDDWWNALGKAANAKEFVMEWATEMVAGHWDGYADNRNNYFINFDKTGKATLLPWGADQTWNGALDYFNMTSVMPGLCANSPTCSEEYLQALAQVSAKAKQLNLAQMVGEIRQSIALAVEADEMGAGTDAWMASANDFLTKMDNQLISLTDMVSPWDATLKSVKLGKTNYSPEKTIYLPQGTSKVKLVATSNNSYASTSGVSQGVHSGLNIIRISTVSADNNHIYETGIKVYVLTNRVSRFTLTFRPKSSTETTVTANLLASLAQKFQGSQTSKITLRISSHEARALSINRINIIRKAVNQFLTNHNVVMIQSGSLKANTITIEAEYTN